jgi:G3E family GTPase
MKDPKKVIPIRLIGGFLGSGKTTLITELINHYGKQGLKVGVITNDQAEDLVDSHHLKNATTELREVAGSCFCCNFKALIKSSEELLASGVDLILAEPVGSCTDLTETVLKPLSDLHGETFKVEPLTVLCDPFRLKAALGIGAFLFPEPVRYIYRTQLDEASFLIINKMDQLSEGELSELLSSLREEFPLKKCLGLSAREHQGLEELFTLWEKFGDSDRHLMKVDYNIYAEGEALLGWMNASAEVHVKENTNEVFDGFVNDLHEEWASKDLEVAHLKVRLENADGWLQSQSSRGQSVPELMGEGFQEKGKAKLIVNARVAADPNALESSLIKKLNLSWPRAEVKRINAFSPAEPKPTHHSFLTN